MPMETVSQRAVLQQRSPSATMAFMGKIERYAQEDSQQKKSPSDKETAALSSSSSSTRKTAKRAKSSPPSDSGFSEKANSSASEELNLRPRRKVLADLGRGSQDENTKIKEPSAARQQIKAQLCQHCCGKGTRLHVMLPLESPLGNLMNFAQIEEEVVQAKVQYAMAKKLLRRERQTLGCASDAIIQRVKVVGKALAELYERRDAIQADKGKIKAFRRLANTTKTKSPPA
jgi:hypothetical protein